MELQALEAAKPEFEKLGASVVAISPQTAPNSRKSVRQNNLTFPILSDARGEIGAAFGLRFKLPDYLVDLYKSLKNDLPAFNDDPGWALPARYVIGQDGTILYTESTRTTCAVRNWRTCCRRCASQLSSSKTNRIVLSRQTIDFRRYSGGSFCPSDICTSYRQNVIIVDNIISHHFFERVPDER
jgi:peroxiredoxin